jgi:hypothetical protein
MFKPVAVLEAFHRAAVLAGSAAAAAGRLG